MERFTREDHDLIQESIQIISSWFSFLVFKKNNDVILSYFKKCVLNQNEKMYLSPEKSDEP